MKKIWEKFLNLLFSKRKIIRSITSVVVILLLFYGFYWSENYWTAGGDFWIAFLVDLITGVIAFSYFIIRWAVDDKWGVMG